MKKIIFGAIALLMLSGCSYKDIANNYIEKHNLGDKVTTVCYDLIDKKECPSNLKQYDIDIVSQIPLTSRFCFGFSDYNDTYPIGMKCYSRDLIK